MIALIFPFQHELSAFLGGEAASLESQDLGPLRALTPSAKPRWRLAVCGQGKVEAALTAQILAERFALQFFFLIGSATALDPGLRVGDVVLADPGIEWDFGGEAAEGHPTFRSSATFPAAAGKETPVLRGGVLSGDRDVFEPKEKAELRRRYGAAALAWEGAGFHRFLRRNRKLGWELRLITEAADEGRTTLATLQARLSAGFPAVRKLLEARF